MEGVVVNCRDDGGIFIKAVMVGALKAWRYGNGGAKGIWALWFLDDFLAVVSEEKVDLSSVHTLCIKVLYVFVFIMIIFFISHFVGLYSKSI